MQRALWNLTGIVAFSVALASGASRAGAEWVDWIADADLAVEYIDNLNNSSFDSDEEDDFAWFPALEAGRVFQLTDRTRASVSATIAGEIYHDFDDLDAYDVGGRLTVFHKFGVGDAPWLRAFFWGGYKGVSEDDRSGARFEVGLEAGKRFSPRFDAAFTYRYTNRDGGNGPVADPTISRDVFDQEYHLFTLAGNFLLLEPLLISTGYTFRLGDFDSANTLDNWQAVLDEANVKAMAMDPVFGGVVYRLDGTGHAAFVNFSWGFTDRISLDLGYRYQYAEDDGLDYSTNAARITLLFRY